MQSSATYKYARVSPSKCRLVADAIRGLPADQALLRLRFLRRAGSVEVQKALHSAVNNASTAHGLDADELVISEVRVNKGTSLKRFLPRAKGRATPKLRRQCHVYVTVSEKAR